MKKLSFILVFSLCASLFVKAQESSGEFKSFSFGLKAIPSLSFFKSESPDFKNASPKLNFGYGLITEFHFAPNYSLLTGLEIKDNGGNFDYVQSQSQGVYYEEYEPQGDTNKFYIKSRKFLTKYLNIPLVLKLKTNEIGYLKYYGQFGVDAGFRLKARATDEGHYENSTSISSKSDVIIDNEINLMRLALNVGLGAEYNLTGSTSLVIGLNYSNGFTNMLKKKSKNLYKEEVNKTELLNQKAYNSYVALTVGILF